MQLSIPGYKLMFVCFKLSEHASPNETPSAIDAENENKKMPTP